MRIIPNVTCNAEEDYLMGHLITFKEFFEDEEGAELNEDNSLLGGHWLVAGFQNVTLLISCLLHNLLQKYPLHNKRVWTFIRHGIV